MTWEIKLTVRELKEILKDLPDDMEVMYQRIEDEYFTEDSGWKDVEAVWADPAWNETTKLIRIFGATVTTRLDTNEKVLNIHAHY